MGRRPSIQSAVKETTEWAILASGTAAVLMHDPFSPAYWSQKKETGWHWKMMRKR